jgi:hypothetical protein
MTEDDKREEGGGPEPGGGEMSEAEIDRNLAETFPASDPPSWTLGTDHRDEAQSPPAPQTVPDRNVG